MHRTSSGHGTRFVRAFLGAPLKIWMGALVGWAAFGAVPAVADDLKVVLQIGPDYPTRLVSWLPGDRTLISVSDQDVLFWSDNGNAIDFLHLPPLPPDTDSSQVSDVTISQDGASATISAKSYGKTGAGCWRYLLPLTARTISLSQVDVGVDQNCPALAGQPRLKAADGRHLEIVNGPVIVQPDGVRLDFPAMSRTTYQRAWLSPDARLVALMRVGWGEGGVSRIQMWDASTGETLPTAQLPGEFKRIEWLSRDRYIAVPEIGLPSFDAFTHSQCISDPLPDAAEVDAVTGKVLRRIPLRLRMTALGTEGAMVALPLPPCATAYTPAMARPVAPVVLRIGAGTTLWRPIVLPAVAKGQILRLAAAYDGRGFAILVSPAPGKPLTLWRFGADGMVKLPSITVAATDASWVQAFGYSRDSSRLLAMVDGVAQFWSESSGAAEGQVVLKTAMPRGITSFVSTTRDRLLVGAHDGKPMAIYAVGGPGSVTREPLATLPSGNFIDAGVIEARKLLWSFDATGVLRLYDGENDRWTRRLTVFHLPDDHFFALDSAFRYDTNAGADSNYFRWLAADSPWSSLPPQTFMRDFYSPGLLTRTLGCIAAGNCASALKTPINVLKLNRTLPDVSVVRVETIPGQAAVRVCVRAASHYDMHAANGAYESGLHNLRLVRDGALVAEIKPPPPGLDGADFPSWASATLLSDQRCPEGTYNFTALLPTTTPGTPIRFSAYAFNSERVKGDTSPPVEVRLPADAPRRTPQAYVISIGVNRYDLPGKSLQFAANDAGAIGKALALLPGYTVHPVQLLSTAASARASASAGGANASAGGANASAGGANASAGGANASAGGANASASRADIKAAIDLLAGRDIAANQALLAAHGVDASGLQKVTPDDAVIISFSGHGFADVRGRFFLLPSDARQPGTPDAEASLISAADLSDWLRDVDAGDMAMIIDACHSAASVASGGFKPGPMGDPGLGQLSFDKGIRILAATQGDDVAREDAELGLGLLTQVLVEQGVQQRGVLTEAKRPAPGHAPDRTTHTGTAATQTVGLDTLLRYAVRQLPAFADARAATKAAAAWDLAMLTPGAAPVFERSQQPQLFDFTGRSSRVRVPLPVAKP